MRKLIWIVFVGCVCAFRGPAVGLTPTPTFGPHDFSVFQYKVPGGACYTMEGRSTIQEILGCISVDPAIVSTPVIGRKSLGSFRFTPPPTSTWFPSPTPESTFTPVPTMRYCIACLCPDDCSCQDACPNETPTPTVIPTP